MTKKIVAEDIKKMSDELSALYSKARTKEEYEKVIRLRELYANTLKANIASPNTVVSTVLPGDWAEYHLYDKFPEGFTDEDMKRFAGEIEALRYSMIDADTKVALLYLESNIWSHLLHNQEKAKWCVEEMDRIISQGKVSTASILKMINSAGNKEMDTKNWTRAVEIFDGINKFSQEILGRSDNLLYTANIINQRGASKNRGKMNPIEGAVDILQAAVYYSLQNEPPAKHFAGLPDRLRESLDNLQSQSTHYVIDFYRKAYDLIERARSLLQPVSGQIEKGQVSREYFEMLAIEISDIRKEIVKLYYT